MDDAKVLYEARGQRAVITLNRPQVLNALDLEAYELLWQALARFRDDPALRVAILTGVGGRAFSTGSDLRSIHAGRAADEAVRVTEGPDPYEIEKPLIAAIDGYCLAGGLEWALRCDIRIATHRSSFGLPEPRSGTLSGYALHHLSRMIPAGEALYLHLTGERIDAERALRAGLVQELIAPEHLMDRAEEIAARIIDCSPLAVEAIKRTVYRNLRRGVEDSYRFVAPIAQALGSSEDAQIGMEAFAAKRKPEWKGR